MAERAGETFQLKIVSAQMQLVRLRLENWLAFFALLQEKRASGQTGGASAPTSHLPAQKPEARSARQPWLKRAHV